MLQPTAANDGINETNGARNLFQWLPGPKNHSTQPLPNSVTFPPGIKKITTLTSFHQSGSELRIICHPLSGTPLTSSRSLCTGTSLVRASNSGQQQRRRKNPPESNACHRLDDQRDVLVALGWSVIRSQQILQLCVDPF